MKKSIEFSLPEHNCNIIIEGDVGILIEAFLKNNPDLRSFITRQKMAKLPQIKHLSGIDFIACLNIHTKKLRESVYASGEHQFDDILELYPDGELTDGVLHYNAELSFHLHDDSIATSENADYSDVHRDFFLASIGTRFPKEMILNKGFSLYDDRDWIDEPIYLPIILEAESVLIQTQRPIMLPENLRHDRTCVLRCPHILNNKPEEFDAEPYTPEARPDMPSADIQQLVKDMNGVYLENTRWINRVTKDLPKLVLSDRYSISDCDLSDGPILLVAPTGTLKEQQCALRKRDFCARGSIIPDLTVLMNNVFRNISLKHGASEKNGQYVIPGTLNAVESIKLDGSVHFEADTLMQSNEVSLERLDVTSHTIKAKKVKLKHCIAHMSNIDCESLVLSGSTRVSGKLTLSSLSLFEDYKAWFDEDNDLNSITIYPMAKNEGMIPELTISSKCHDVIPLNQCIRMNNPPTQSSPMNSGFFYISSNEPITLFKSMQNWNRETYEVTQGPSISNSVIVDYDIFGVWDPVFGDVLFVPIMTTDGWVALIGNRTYCMDQVKEKVSTEYLAFWKKVVNKAYKAALKSARPISTTKGTDE
ncbi:hypothetical protein AB6D11_00685 [Vibrio splendidus]